MVDESLQDRLSRALQDLDERDRRIRILEQQLQTSNGIRPLDAGPGSGTMPTTPASRPSTLGVARKEDVPRWGDVGSTAPASRTIQWHAVTIDSHSPDVQSSAPTSQRRTERHAAELIVEFDLDTQFYTGITQDISEGGVFIATYRIHPVGTSIGLAFDLPCGTRVEARGEVRWVREISSGCRPGMGVAFVDLDSEALTAIARFCRDHAPLYVEL